jgi:tellurite resistance protein TerC
VHAEAVGGPALWIGFTTLVLALLALDLGVLHRRDHEVGVREALGWTAVWIGLALAFGTAVHVWYGAERALEFLAGFVIEKSLSIDNLFVFLVLFSSFSVPRELQHRVLFWGIVGALALRASLILAGTALLREFHGVAYVFGALLVLTGVKLLVDREGQVDPQRNPVFRLFRRVVPSVDEYHGRRFWVLHHGRRHATPLLLVLVAIEATDLVFALDSIPAIFAVTRDPFIVYTSNVFAMLGLRSLYFALAGMLGRFHALKTGLALVLTFAGGKMLFADLYEVPILLSLGVIGSLIGGSIAASLLWPKTVAQPAGRIPLLPGGRMVADSDVPSMAYAWHTDDKTEDPTDRFTKTHPPDSNRRPAA